MAISVLYKMKAFSLFLCSKGFCVLCLRSDILGVILSEDIDHALVVFLDVGHVASDAVHCLFHIVVCLNDAILESESTGVAVSCVHGLESPEDSAVLLLLAIQDLLIVSVAILEMSLLIAILGCSGKVLTLHFLEWLGDTVEEVIHPLLREISWRLPFDLAIVDGLELMELLVVVILKHLLQDLLRKLVICWVHIV